MIDQDERNEYLEGVLWSDKDLRMDRGVDADAIDPFGTGTKAFWRGLLEGAGSMSIGASGPRSYPRIELQATYAVLGKFLQFLQEEIHTRRGVEWAWDEEGKLEWQARGEFLRVTGKKAQDIVRVLYLDQTVGRQSVRHVADKIIAWSGRK
jgi:hypothetical protein